MKNCCLWINGKKISDINGIKENFNITDVRGYFYGGRFADWLEAHGGREEARLVRNIPKGANPDNILQEIFCGKKNVSEVAYHRQSVQPPFIKAENSVSANRTLTAEVSSLNGSYRVGTGSFGSYRHQFEFEKGSFTRSSFKLGSFSYGSFSFGSYAGFLTAKNGSFNYDDFVNTLRVREKALLSYFTSEPLNKFGYGIHLI